MNTFNKIGSVFLTILAICGSIASISAASEGTKRWLVPTLICVSIIGIFWVLNTYFEFAKAIRILNGAKRIGLTNIKPDRQHSGTYIAENLARGKNVKVFGVSGNQFVQDFGREIRIALHENAANIQVIFSTMDDVVKYAVNQKGDRDNFEDLNVIAKSCRRLVNYLAEAKKIADKDNKMVGTIEVGFFRSHNRLPMIIVDEDYAAFHISVPPEESNESVFFEINDLKSNFYTEDKLLKRYLKHFELHWQYLIQEDLVTDVEKFNSALAKIKNTNNRIDLTISQEVITNLAKYNFNNKRLDRNYDLGANDLIFNHHFGIGYVENLDDFLKQSSQDMIARELHKLELNQIDTLLKMVPKTNSNMEILDAGCGRGGTSITVAENIKAKVTGINISDYQVAFATRIAKEKLCPNVDFMVMDFHNLNFDDSSFDCVILNEVSMYSYFLDRIIKECYRVLRPGGRLIIATWCLKKSDISDVWVRRINDHYGVCMNELIDYKESLNNLFAKYSIKDYTNSAVDYFKIRSKWSQKSDIEDAYLDGFSSNGLGYYFMTADK